MVARFKISVDRLLTEVTDKAATSIAAAAVEALKETAVETVEEGRRNIATAGRFGANWQRDLQSRMLDAAVGGKPSLHAKAIIFHKSALAGIFESGITIVGRPLLWIPTTPGAPPIKHSGKRLTFAIVRGTHLAFDADDRDRHRRPLYFGVPVAHIAKKWRITEIAKEHVAKISELFAQFFKG